MARFMLATLKALRLVKHNREAAVDAIVKFSEVKRELAERKYDEVIRTFASNGVVDEKTQKTDLDIVRLVPNVNKEVLIERAYNFSFAAQADKELTRAGWRP